MSPYLIRRYVRILPVFHKTLALMIASKFYKRRGIFFPIHWESFQVFKNGSDAGLFEEFHRVFCVLIKIGIKDTLIHEPRIIIEKHSSQVVKFSREQEDADWVPELSIV